MTVVVGSVFFLLFKTSFGEGNKTQKEIKVTIPENLDYNEIFEDLFKKYTVKSSLERVKTTNLGSMYELSYLVELKDNKKEKELIDEMRCRNGNLTIICGRPLAGKEQL
ncbi:hypothetical protein [Sporanaerobium hydrogeniformans]|uniref:hypothetical protein n=1 Tax=Sporanaerobium hydrogeniformans TaxID=3072179 RepID=UPI0026A463CB|nr:hypothetical protein [Sporanaerobium hydrogeniformans]